MVKPFFFFSIHASNPLNQRTISKRYILTYSINASSQYYTTLTQSFTNLYIQQKTLWVQRLCIWLILQVSLHDMSPYYRTCPHTLYKLIRYNSRIAMQCCSLFRRENEGCYHDLFLSPNDPRTDETE